MCEQARESRQEEPPAVARQVLEGTVVQDASKHGYLVFSGPDMLPSYQCILPQLIWNLLLVS